MSKFNFDHAEDDTLNVRMSKVMAAEIRAIAKKEKITIQEVCRTLLMVALDDYRKEQS